MADVRINPQDVVRTGLAPTYTGSLSVSNTYLVANNGRTFLHFKKSGAGACNVTIQTPGSVDGLAVSELVVQVPATTGDKMIGPFPEAIYNQSGDVKCTLDEITGLTVAAIRVP